MKHLPPVANTCQLHNDQCQISGAPSNPSNPRGHCAPLNLFDFVLFASLGEKTNVPFFAKVGSVGLGDVLAIPKGTSGWPQEGDSGSSYCETGTVDNNLNSQPARNFRRANGTVSYGTLDRRSIVIHRQ